MRLVSPLYAHSDRRALHPDVTPDGNSIGTLLGGALRLPGTTGRTRRFRAGEVLFSSGEPGDGFYLIESGRVQIFALVGRG